MKTVILDTNIWTYIAEYSLGKALGSLVEKGHLKVLVPPSILLEAARTQNIEVRVSIFRELRNPKWHRLRTEADLESEELVQEIRRLRPGLVKTSSNIKRIIELRRFWTAGIWKLAAEDPVELGRRATRPGEIRVAELHAEEQKDQKEALSPWDVNKTIPSGITARFDPQNKAFEGLVDFDKEYEPWRVECIEYYRRVLAYTKVPMNHQERTIVDWCEPWFKIDHFTQDRKGFYSFWLEEVELSQMPRNYLRWAVNLLQSKRKIGSGNPYDAQHCSYLPDADLFLTSDRRYFDILDTVHSDAVVQLSRPILLRAPRQEFEEDLTSALLGC